MITPRLDSKFLDAFKRATEAKWSTKAIDPTLYGFQFQQGTRWNPGLSEGEIYQYQKTLNLSFPIDFAIFLRTMNGTDLPTLNVYGSSGQAPRQSVGVYSYPRDIDIVRQRINDVESAQRAIITSLREQGVDLSLDTRFIPFFSHRYLISTQEQERSIVLSIYGTDAVIYGDCLRSYLEREFLNHPIESRHSEEN